MMFGPIGYYLDCDTAVCDECFDPDQWQGFEDCSEPLPISEDDEADTPTHCARCEELIAHALTPDGIAYVEEAYARASVGDGRKCIVKQWVLEYLDKPGWADVVAHWPNADAYSPMVDDLIR